jgi:hypothetical protein
MPTCRQIIKDALVERGVTDPAEEPDNADARTALRALIGLYQEDVCGRIKLKPVAVSSNYTAAENEEVTDTSGTATISLPETVDLDGAEALHDGRSISVRKPRDRSVVAVVGDAPKLYLYDKMIGDWVDVLALTLTSEAPLSRHYRSGLVARLTELLPYPGIPVGAFIERRSLTFVSAMGARPDVARDPVRAEFF